MADTVERVNAQPVKRFFIDIITRDIGLNAAILDLVDNSVDSARLIHKDGDFTDVKIAVVARPGEFSIEDNCGGIAVEHAKDYVFRMGRPEEVNGNDGSIGQFGVGLKRSLFKLGSKFIVNSVSSNSDFTVDLDVLAWVQRSDWDFDIVVHDRSEHEETGTTIIVDRLHASVSTSFANPDYIADLVDDLKSRHRVAIGNGLKISLNGDDITGAASEVAGSNLISAATDHFSVDTPAGTVRVTVVAGVAPRDSGLDEDAEPEDVEFPAAEAGWEVFGNGRLLLSADKSKVTGWGSGKGKLPLFHNQYARFRGFVYMDAEDSSAIPWNTMKTGVDQADPVWIRVRESMITTGKDVAKLLNHVKVERQAGAKGADAPITTALDGAAPVTVVAVTAGLYSIPMADLRDDSFSPAHYPDPNPDLNSGLQRISYLVEVGQFRVVSEALGESAAAGVGRSTFRFYYDDVAD